MVSAVTPLVLITGFGPFEEVRENPSGALALRLEAQPPPGLRVRSSVLPVSFARGPEAFGAVLGSLGERPALILGLGVHKEPGYRIELRARARLDKPERGDVDGVPAAEVRTPPGPDLRTPLEERLEDFAAGRDAWRLSEEAGEYVCERVYRVQLEESQRLGCPALFVHVPSYEYADLGEQAREFDTLLAELLAPAAR